ARPDDTTPFPTSRIFSRSKGGTVRTRCGPGGHRGGWRVRPRPPCRRTARKGVL
ncbi:COG0028: Thiamine pyrophosphate-requiring enzymes, partial [Arthrobacter sp. DR-2P]